MELQHDLTGPPGQIRRAGQAVHELVDKVYHMSLSLKEIERLQREIHNALRVINQFANRLMGIKEEEARQAMSDLVRYRRELDTLPCDDTENIKLALVEAKEELNQHLDLKIFQLS